MFHHFGNIFSSAEDKAENNICLQTIQEFKFEASFHPQKGTERVKRKIRTPDITNRF